MDAWLKKVDEMKKLREQKWQYKGQTASPSSKSAESVKATIEPPKNAESQTKTEIQAATKSDIKTNSAPAKQTESIKPKTAEPAHTPATTTASAPSNPFLQKVRTLTKTQSEPVITQQLSPNRPTATTSTTQVSSSTSNWTSRVPQKTTTSSPPSPLSSTPTQSPQKTASPSANPFLKKISLRNVTESPTKANTTETKVQEAVPSKPAESPSKTTFVEPPKTVEATPKATLAVPTFVEGPKPKDDAKAKRIQERKSRRMTKRQTVLLSNSVITTVDSVLHQIGGIDKRLRQSEAARIQAEDKLMEIAIAKLEVDEVLHKVDGILKKIVDSPTLTLPQILVKVRKEISSDDDSPSGSNRRFSIIIPKDALKLGRLYHQLIQAEEEAPPPPVLDNKGSSQTASTGLLEQIRKGTALRNISVSKLKEEQQQFRKQAREAMGNMKSLEEILRDALTKRVTEMNLYDDEAEDGDGETWD